MFPNLNCEWLLIGQLLISEMGNIVAVFYPQWTLWPTTKGQWQEVSQQLFIWLPCKAKMWIKVGLMWYTTQEASLQHRGFKNCLDFICIFLQGCRAKNQSITPFTQGSRGCYGRRPLEIKLLLFLTYSVLTPGLTDWFFF